LVSVYLPAFSAKLNTPMCRALCEPVCGGNVDFEGRKVRVISISGRTGRGTPYSARLDLDLGDEYVVLLGYFRGGEFIEEGRERPF
jgi:hypothetical protein